jgi:hypothetical protein
MGNTQNVAQGTSGEGEELRAASLELPIAQRYSARRKLHGIAASASGWLYVVFGHSIAVLDPMRKQRLVYGKADEAGYKNGSETNCRFTSPHGIRFIDDLLFVCDTQNFAIRRIRPGTIESNPINTLIPIHGLKSRDASVPQFVDTSMELHNHLFDPGLVETFTGGLESGWRDGPLAEALWSEPMDLTVGKLKGDRKAIFVLDHERIRMISSDSMVGSITRGSQSYWENPFTNTENAVVFHQSWSICAVGSRLFVTSAPTPSSNHRMVHVVDVEKRHFYPVKVHNERRADIIANGSGENFWSVASGLCALSDGRVVVCDTDYHMLSTIDSETLEDKPLLDPQAIGPRKVKDGPLSLSHTVSPNYITVTPRGDLVWTEQNSESKEGPNLIRYIAGFDKLRASSSGPHFAQRTKSVPKSFATHISVDNLHRFGDLELFHKDSRTYFYLNRSLISLAAPGLLEPETLRKVSDSTVPQFILRQFLSILYGSGDYRTSTIDAKALCMDLAHMLHLVHLVGIDKANLFRLSLESRFHHSLGAVSAISGRELIEHIFTSFGQDCQIAYTVMLALRSFHPQYFDFDIDALIPPAFIDSHWQQMQHPDIINVPKGWTFLDEPLAKCWERLESSSILTYGLPNFRIDVKSSQETESIFIHDWVLYGRWSYFRRTIDAGLSESLLGFMELPSHFSPSFLNVLIRFFYLPDTPIRDLTLEECCWLAEYGPQFDLLSIDGFALPGLEQFAEQVQWQSSSPLTVENGTDVFTIRMLLKGDPNALLEISRFLAQNIHHFDQSPMLRSKVQALLDRSELTQVPSEGITTLRALVKKQ